MTTIFGNPGSTELPMLAEFPDDFRYVLGLQEAVGGRHGRRLRAGQRVGRAREPAHRARAWATAWARSSTPRPTSRRCWSRPGQQSRSLMTLQANLTNRDATRMPHPLVKWSYEPPRAEDVPHALARAIHLAELPPQGPGVRLDPHGRLGGRGRRRRRRAPDRGGPSAGAPGADPAAVADAGRAAGRGRATGARGRAPTWTPSGAWDAAVALAEAQRLAVWATPAPGGGRIGFPEDHALFQGILPPAVGPAGRDAGAPTTWCSSSGSSVFPYYPNIPGPLLAEGTALVAITSDPDEAARAPMGDAIVADVALTLRRAGSRRRESDRTAPEPPGAPRRSRSRTDSAEPHHRARGAGGGVPRRRDRRARVAVEHARAAQPAAALAPGLLLLRRRRRAGLRPAGGDRGPARAARSRPVVCVLGEGSAQYAIQGLWTAAAYEVPVTFLVLRNDEYAILKWFAALEDGDRRARARPAGARHRGTGQRLRREGRAGGRARRAARRRCAGRSRPRSRGWSRSV